VLANKQDCEGAMAVEDIKQMFNKLIVGKMNVSEGGVLPISALRGYVGSLTRLAFLAITLLIVLAPTGTVSEKQSTGSSCECTSEPCLQCGLFHDSPADFWLLGPARGNHQCIDTCCSGTSLFFLCCV
jgi:hypothetical protein